MLIRETYEAEMDSIRESLMRLSRMAELSVQESVRILKNRLFKEGEELIRNDDVINGNCVEIEEACLSIIATQQPVAGDLRFIFAAMQIAMELERIADYGKGIAVINKELSPGEHVKPLVDIPRMSVKACEMLRKSIESFLNRDIAAAEEIPSMDVEIDLLYEQIYKELITHVMQKPEIINDAMMLTFVAHNLERVGDRVVNICERVVYLCTGEVVDLG